MTLPQLTLCIAELDQLVLALAGRVADQSECLTAWAERGHQYRAEIERLKAELVRLQADGNRPAVTFAGTIIADTFTF